MAHIGKEHRTRFKILRETDRMENSRRFVLETDTGPKTMWCPKSQISVYKYGQGDTTLWEVWIPDWLAEKAGLI